MAGREPVATCAGSSGGAQPPREDPPRLPSNCQSDSAHQVLRALYEQLVGSNWVPLEHLGRIFHNPMKFFKQCWHFTLQNAQLVQNIYCLIEKLD
ncbi:hypothetical protein PHJA_002319200 [Phtheirospermum japonicum]|uniref:Uncharacterized protein n=1 Tax=Phtheirospermum japonicum TaxID=374723 RepID=A0A830CU69_9LAMI|nr:hypothetical protein PHJA_002319200 [Phtheirospermum japonicum]